MAEYLPTAAWTKREDLAALVATLGAGNARYVGGAVRDTLLGIAAKDIDIATPLVPSTVTGRCANAKIRTIPTGIEHGTVTALLEQGTVEITTLRQDVSTDGRRATVAFSTDWREDAARRDFTINALYADPETLEIADFFGGLDDLKARRVRFIGDARQRIREDHLRILRYFRFQARFGSQPADQEAEESCSELAGTLKGLSRERIGMEMMAILALPDPAPILSRMQELGVLAEILPEAQVDALASLVTEEQRQDIAPDPLRRLASLLPADVPLAEQVAMRFRLSGAQKKRLALAARRSGEMPPRNGEVMDPRALAYRFGIDAAMDRLLLAGADLSRLRNWTKPTFPLKGGAIVTRGVKAGPQVARMLQAVEARWVAEGFPDETRVLALLNDELASQSQSPES